jgi:two-component system phosphate regulon sensor histidine kinase PhoR
VANVSHELRTPLTVICGYLETLLDNVEEVNPRWVRALQQMQQQGGRMQTLLNDLLLLVAGSHRLTTSPWQSRCCRAFQRPGPIRARTSDHLDSKRRLLKGSEAELRSVFQPGPTR